MQWGEANWVFLLYMLFVFRIRVRNVLDRTTVWCGGVHITSGLDATAGTNLSSASSAHCKVCHQYAMIMLARMRVCMCVHLKLTAKASGSKQRALQLLLH